MIKFDELLNIASKKSGLTGKELSRKLIEMFCVVGTEKEKQVNGISQMIFILLEFNGYYENVTNEFWDLESIKDYVGKCI